MFLQTDDGTHRNFYTEQFICADTFTQGGLCTEKLLHADAFTHRCFYAKNCQCFAQRCLCATKKARRRFYTQNPLRRETFGQNNFCTKKLHKKRWHRKTCPQRLHKKNYTPKHLHAETLPRTTFTLETFPHRNLCALQFLHGRFHTQMPLHKKSFTHRNLCTQHAFTHNQLLHREALLPLLDRLIRVPPPKWYNLAISCMIEIYNNHICNYSQVINSDWSDEAKVKTEPSSGSTHSSLGQSSESLFTQSKQTPKTARKWPEPNTDQTNNTCLEVVVSSK